eukprot:5631050-Pleurochrysis_carterae.AAC.1
MVSAMRHKACQLSSCEVYILLLLAKRAGSQTASIPVLRAHLQGLKIGTGHLCAFATKRT